MIGCGLVAGSAMGKIWFGVRRVGGSVAVPWVDATFSHSLPQVVGGRARFGYDTRTRDTKPDCARWRET
jgi:hypothetical protein